MLFRSQWRGSQVPTILAEKVRGGGCVTFASAAALTLGAVTVPVYEIYKVGEEPRWLEGLGLMAEAAALVGNSSAALIEAPYLRLPAVNVGDRQRGRERDANVIDAELTAAAVAAALERARTLEFRLSLDTLRPRLGDGRASERIVAMLKGTERDRRLLSKQLGY